MFDHVRIVHSGGRTCQGARYMPESKEEGPNFNLANLISFRMNYIYICAKEINRILLSAILHKTAFRVYIMFTQIQYAPKMLYWS